MIFDELAAHWLQYIFHAKTDPNDQRRARILLLDNVEAHLTVEFITFALEHNIKLVYLPPNSKHFLQPVDVGVLDH